MRWTTSAKAARCLIALVSAGLAVSCATPQLEGFDATIITVQESSALSGSSLAQRKLEMQRSLIDMRAMYETMDGILDRRDSSSVAVFSAFVSKYLSAHVDPLLQPAWHSTHAELIDVDSNLRVLRSGMLLQMRRLTDVNRTLNDLETRYGTRTRLLIDYPLGEQSVLGDVVTSIRSQVSVCADANANWGPGARSRNASADARERAICAGPV